MPKKSAREYGSEYVTRFTSLFEADPDLSAEEKAAVRKALSKEKAVEALGADVLRQEDYSRLAQESSQARTRAELHKQQLDEWADRQQAELQEAAALKAALAARGISLNDLISGTTSTPPAPPVQDTALLERLDRVERNFGAFVKQGMDYATILPKYVATHFHQFKEPLDTIALRDFCIQNNLPLDRGGYDAFVADKVKAQQEADLSRRIKEAEERGASRAREEFGKGTPYPVGYDDAYGNSGIAKLLTPSKPNGEEFTAEAAARTYLENMSKRSPQ